MLSFMKQRAKQAGTQTFGAFLLMMFLIVSSTVSAQTEDFNLELLHVQGNVYLVAGGGGNTALLVGEQGVVVVDSKLNAASDELIALIEDNFEVPIRWIVNTHAHADHVGGNAALAAVGSPIGASPSAESSVSDPAPIYSHIGVTITMVSADELDLDGLPGNTYTNASMEFYANGESVQLIHQPAAHTGGDSLVFFRQSNVLVAGDIFTIQRYPFIDVANGGSVRGLIDALNNMLALIIPNINQQGGTYVIPGHGRITDEYEVVNYRDMLTIIYERIEDAVARGLSLEEVKAERLSREYDPLYGSDTGFWTTEQFIETIYAELSQ
tara:strand:- start:82 stop:1056 length:975 start_codon:yes stop_codon:yes gene_type:complete